MLRQAHSKRSRKESAIENATNAQLADIVEIRRGSGAESNSPTERAGPPEAARRCFVVRPDGPAHRRLQRSIFALRTKKGRSMKR